MSPHLEHHVRSERSLLENVFRYGSSAWAALIREARIEYNAGRLTELYDDDLQTLESELGEIAFFEGREVLLEVPLYDWNREVWVLYARDPRNRISEVSLPRNTFSVYGTRKVV